MSIKLISSDSGTHSCVLTKQYIFMGRVEICQVIWQKLYQKLYFEIIYYI